MAPGSQLGVSSRCPRSCPRADPAPLHSPSPHASESPRLLAWGRDRAGGLGKGPSHPRWDTLLPSAGTAAGFPGTPSWPSVGWGAAGGAPIPQAAPGPAAARPGPPGAALSPGKKRKVTGTISRAASFLSCPTIAATRKRSGCCRHRPQHGRSQLQAPSGSVAAGMPVNVHRLCGTAVSQPAARHV